MENKTRAVIYLRVSTQTQAEEGFSLDAQERTLRQHCELKKYETVRVYTDAGISGKDIKHRPALRRLLEDSKSKEFDIILVWKITRFTRSLSDLCSTCDFLESKNIYLESYSEAFDSRTTTGRMMRGILGVIAQWERETIAENVCAGLKERAMQGNRTASVSLGYDIDKESGEFVVNVEESEIVKFVFESFLEFKNLSFVARLCKERGYVGKRGVILTPQSVAALLTRPLYAGWNTWKGQPISKGKHAPLVDVEVFNKVQRILSKNKIGRKRTKKLMLIKEEKNKKTL
jgi:Site-specific recombinases, DNA invertase Pin homologs